MTISKSDIKFIRSLSQKKFRDESGLFIAEGEKLVQEAIDSNFEVETIYRAEEIGLESMGRISALSSPSPILALIKRPIDRILESVDQIRELISPTDLYLGLDSLRDPGNVGTIIRLSDWFGIEAIFASKDSVDIYNPKVVQSTMGAIFRKSFYYVDLNLIVEEFKQRGLPIYGTFLEGENIYKEELSKGGLVVMGSEANGISSEIKAAVTKKLFIPPFPAEAITSESLNVAIATAIICSEFRRR